MDLREGKPVIQMQVWHGTLSFAAPTQAGFSFQFHEYYVPGLQGGCFSKAHFAAAGLRSREVK